MVVLPYTFSVCGISVEASEVVVTVKVESGLPEMPLTFAEGIAYAIVPRRFRGEPARSFTFPNNTDGAGIPRRPCCVDVRPRPYGAAPNPLSSCVYPSAGGPEWRVAMRCETSLLAWVCLIVSSPKMPAAHWLFSTTPRD